jgi:hypothetical protein
MIRVLRAFTWLRWRLVVNSLRSAERRDTLERVSHVAALVVPALVVVTSATSVAVSAVLGGVGGWVSVTHAVQSAWVLPTIRVLLLLATALAAFVPIFVGAHGGSGRFTRLQLLPIPRQTLHFGEVSTSLTDPWLVSVLPGLVGYACGLIAAALSTGEPHPGLAIAGGVALVAAIGMAFVLASLSALVTFSVSWLVRDRRRSEMFVVLVVLALSSMSILPALLSSNLERQMSAHLANGEASPGPLIALPNGLPTWTVVLPSELYGRAVRFAPEWPSPATLLPLAGLFLEGTILYGLSSMVYRKRVEIVEGGRLRPRRPVAGTSGPIRIPGFWPGTAAVAMAQTRTALRSVRGRLVVLLPGPLVAMFALLLRGLQHAGGAESLMASRGYLAFGAGLMFGLYAAQAFTMNQFGSDRAGLTLQFLAPIRDVDLVRGKTVGCAIIIGAGALVSFACAVSVAPGGSAWLWLATFVGGVAAFLILSPVAAWVSALFPVASDLSKTGSGGNPHTFVMLAGMAAVAAATAPAGLILAIFSPMVALLAMTIWMTVAGAVAYPLLAVVARTLKARRENLAQVAQGR